MSRDIDQTLEELKDRITELVANGFWSPEDVEEIAVDFFEDEVDLELLRGPAKEFTRKAFNAHRAEQASWPAVTDCDRLDSAFAELEERGIISRQNFSCCGTCGSAEIAEPMDAAMAQGKDIRGYTFYHQQDTDAAVEGDGIYLCYGAKGGGMRAGKKIAAEIVEVLRNHGLKSEWNGWLVTRIHVPLDWKRRID